MSGRLSSSSRGLVGRYARRIAAVCLFPNCTPRPRGWRCFQGGALLMMPTRGYNPG